jgi:GntR family transcriptional regulator
VQSTPAARRASTKVEDRRGETVHSAARCRKIDGMSVPRRTAPLYQRIADTLIARIQSGEFGVGSQFPTEFELCAHYAISRHTARAALSLLGDQGLIQRRPGAGTRVTAPTPPMRYQQEVVTIEDLMQYSRHGRLDVSACARAVAPAEIAGLLKLRGGTRAVRLFGLRYGDAPDTPICSTEIFLRPARGLPMTALLDPHSAVAAMLKVLDLQQIDHVEQSFDAIELPAIHASLLGLKPGSAALRVLRTYYSRADTAVGCALSLHPAGRFAYSMRLQRRRPG